MLIRFKRKLTKLWQILKLTRFTRHFYMVIEGVTVTGVGVGDRLWFGHSACKLCRQPGMQDCDLSPQWAAW